MSFFEKLSNLDRRWFYLVITLFVAAPLIKPIGLPIAISSTTLQSWKVMQELKPGDRVLFAFNYTVSSIPDVDPGARAFFNYFMQKGLKVVGVAFTAQGDAIADKIMTEWEAKGKKYGVDFVNLGYVAGLETAITKVAADIASVTRDYRGKPATPESFPILQGLKKASDFQLGVNVNASTPGPEEWVRQVVDPYKLPFLTVHVTIGAPRVMPYVQSKQVAGLVIGLRGAAELEQLMNQPGKASSSMDCQSLGHVGILLFIVLGNIGYFATRRNAPAKGS